MSANAETQTPQQPVKKSGKRKRLLLLLTLGDAANLLI